MRQPGFSHIEDTKEWLQFFKTRVAIANLRMLEVIHKQYDVNISPETWREWHKKHGKGFKIGDFLSLPK